MDYNREAASDRARKRMQTNPTHGDTGLADAGECAGLSDGMESAKKPAIQNTKAFRGESLSLGLIPPQMTVLPGIDLSAVEEGKALILEPDILMNQHNKAFVTLYPSLLVRLKVQRDENDPVSILCVSEEMAQGSIRILLPCTLNLTAGHAADMELFLPTSSTPIQMQGIVREVDQVGHEDIIRYVVELEFYHPPSSAAREVASFLQSSQKEHSRQMLA